MCSTPGWEVAPPQSRAVVVPLSSLGSCISRVHGQCGQSGAGSHAGPNLVAPLLQKRSWLLAGGPGPQSPARTVLASTHVNEGKGLCPMTDPPWGS